MPDRLVHIAAPDIQVNNLLRQRCGWCGAILLDYDLDRVAVPEGQDPRPATWAPGTLVEVDGGASWTVPAPDGGQLPDGACGRLAPPPLWTAPPAQHDHPLALALADLDGALALDPWAPGEIAAAVHQLHDGKLATELAAILRQTRANAKELAKVMTICAEQANAERASRVDWATEAMRLQDQVDLFTAPGPAEVPHDQAIAEANYRQRHTVGEHANRVTIAVRPPDPEVRYVPVPVERGMLR